MCRRTAAPPFAFRRQSHRRSWLAMAVGTTGARATIRPPLKRSSSRSTDDGAQFYLSLQGPQK
eukprot:5570958-Prymnesium_polylepis.1